jgi:hypothetical protein
MHLLARYETQNTQTNGRNQRASPKQLFGVFADAEKHGELTGAKVTASRKGGAIFSAFDGFVASNPRIYC